MSKPEELRLRILVHLEQHSRTDSGTYVNDTDLATATGASVEEVRRQLDILEAQGLTREANSMGQHSAIISPAGSLAIEGVMDTVPAKRKIGF